MNRIRRIRGSSLTLCALLLGALSAVSNTGRADDDLRLGDLALAADPNAPMFAYGYRGGARGRFSLDIPILSPESFGGAYLSLRPLAELHNEEDEGLSGPAFLPLSYWRGRVALEGGYAPRVTIAGTPVQLGFGLMLEHESNHMTDATPIGFLSFHDVGVRTQLAVRVHPKVLFAAQLTGRVLFASCTKLSYGCTGDRGTGGFETVADVWVEIGLKETAFGGAFALHASYLPGTESLIEEWRIAVRGGLLIAPNAIGRFQLFLEALVGHDVGLFRAREVARVGIGFGWAI